METKDQILDLLQARANLAVEKARRCIILQPGAIGDCVLTLPLAHFIKKQLKVGSIEMISKMDYTGYFPQRTCVDSIRAIDSVDMHRLFSEPKDFKLEDKDPLIDLFAGYSYIVSFMGGADSHFERNLIFTVNCSNSAEVIMLDQIPVSNQNEHISLSHIKNFRKQYDIGITEDENILRKQLIDILPADITTGREILNNVNIKKDKKLIVMHPGGGNIKKSWNLGNFISLTISLQKQNEQVLFLLGPAELERFTKPQLAAINDIAHVLTELSLTQVLQVLSCSDCFIGNDSGITHLAAGSGVKTVAMFCPTNPEVYSPVGPDVTVIKDNSEIFANQPSPELQQRALTAINS